MSNAKKIIDDLKKEARNTSGIDIEIHSIGMDEFMKVLGSVFHEDDDESEIDLLPSWAVRKVNPNRIECMTQLATRDGRATGNGVIFDISYCLSCDDAYFSIVTDAGNIIHLTAEELQEIFHAPRWISKDFPNSKMEDVVRAFYDDKNAEKATDTD